MPQNPVDENTLAQCVHWDFSELQLRAKALGIDEDAQKQAYVELFRGVSAERWTDAQRTIDAIRARTVNGEPAAVMLELSRGRIVAPPVKSIQDLEAAARDWFAARKWPAAFLPTVHAAILELEPQPGPGREWLRGGLQGIAGGSSTHLGPRPADPVFPTQEELLRQGAETAKKHLADRKLMKENFEAGRGMAATEWK